MFFLGRKCGRKILVFFTGEDNANKMCDLVSSGKYVYFLMMLFPLFPDDVLCMVAGIGDMSFKYFFVTNLISRSIGIACAVFFGSGKVIPFKGFGIVVWSIIGLFILFAFYFSIKYKDKIDEFLSKKFVNKKN